jgi:hypothetical protein
MTNRGNSKLRREPQTVAAALSRGAGHLLRQVRKFAALRACLDSLPPELAGMAAPYDVRQWERSGQFAGAAKPSGHADDLGQATPASVSVLCIYVLSPTVEAVLKRLAPELIVGINARLPYPLVEELRLETASKQKIEQQVNILRAEPD